MIMALEREKMDNEKSFNSVNDLTLKQKIRFFCSLAFTKNAWEYSPDLQVRKHRTLPVKQYRSIVYGSEYWSEFKPEYYQEKVEN